MTATLNLEPKLFPLELGVALIASNTNDLAQAVINESDNQLAEAKSKRELEDESDFLISCDGLNFWRMAWRCSEAAGGVEVPGLQVELSEMICRFRSYNWEEFEHVKAATRDRVRMPFGMAPLEYAFGRAQRYPIRLVAPHLQNQSLLALIAGIALQLHWLQKGKPFLLPIESVRDLLRLRKIVVSGVVKQLVDNKIIEVVGEKYHTNRAREFQFTGQENVHWIWATATQ